MENPQIKKQEKRLAKNQKNHKKQKKEINKEKQIKQQKGKKKRTIPQTAQETLPYKRIFPDGICQIDDKKYSKSIRFYDINYLLAQNEDKSLIFENYCDFLNYFDSSISIQLSFINQSGNTDAFIDNIDIKEQQDNFNDIRTEYSNMLKNQMGKGNNGLLKTKYITFSIEADNIKLAKPRLERIETDILNNFKVMGVQAYSLTGKERVELLHSICNQNARGKLDFNWDIVKNGGMGTKDLIVPTSFNFSDPRNLRMGEMVGTVSFLQILAPELTDRIA